MLDRRSNVPLEYKVEDFLELLVNGESSEIDSLDSGNESDENRNEIEVCLLGCQNLQNHSPCTSGRRHNVLNTSTHHLKTDEKVV
ncbi:hypothetical protein GJAV_G00187450 [Gymnothorax javanicus]|nr:hypothetical protein GJAV_G00187450 [Gymnothorax javanicus]